MPVSSVRVASRIERTLQNKAHVKLDALFNFQDLLAAIHTGFKINMMRAVQFTCDLVFNIGIRGQCVMRSPHITLRLGNLTLWNSHFVALSIDLAVLIYQRYARFCDRLIW